MNIIINRLTEEETNKARAYYFDLTGRLISCSMEIENYKASLKLNINQFIFEEIKVFLNQAENNLIELKKEYKIFIEENNTYNLFS